MIGNYFFTKEFRVRIKLYLLLILFFVLYFFYLSIISISLDILIGMNLLFLLFIGYLFLSKWLNLFFELKIKKVYIKLMNLFYVVNKVLNLNLKAYYSLFNLLKVSFFFFYKEITNFNINISKLKNNLLNKFFLNLFMKYFFFKLQFVNNINIINYNTFFFVNFNSICKYFFLLSDRLLING